MLSGGCLPAAGSQGRAGLKAAPLHRPQLPAARALGSMVLTPPACPSRLPSPPNTYWGQERDEQGWGSHCQPRHILRYFMFVFWAELRSQIAAKMGEYFAMLAQCSELNLATAGRGRCLPMYAV